MSEEEEYIIKWIEFYRNQLEQLKNDTDAIKAIIEMNPEKIPLTNRFLRILDHQVVWSDILKEEFQKRLDGYIDLLIDCKKQND